MIALNTKQVPRFVLRVKLGNQDSDSDSIPYSPVTFLNVNGDVSLNSSISSASSFKTDKDHAAKPELPKAILKHSENHDVGSAHVRNSPGKHVIISPDVSDTPVSPGGNEKKRNKPKRKASFTEVAASMLRRKKQEKSKHENTELSTYRLAPGILKVFGDHVSPGSNYKSVRASTISTAQEVVKQALEKYSLEGHNPADYILCDVVGHFKVDSEGKKGQVDEEAQWITEYVREISDNEKPLVLQSLWKPATGRSRRFELRKRIEVESSCFYINTSENLINRNSILSTPTSDSERSSVASAGEGRKRGDSIFSDVTSSFTTSADDSDNKKVNVKRMASDASHLTNSRPSIVATDLLRTPKHVPFLLLIQGYKPEADLLIYRMDEQSTIFGTSETESKPYFLLSAPDILPQHCVIHKKVSIDKNALETNLDDITFQVFMEPCPGAEVLINGVPIVSSTLIQPGQLVSLGQYYLFIFKDSSKCSDAALKLSWLENLKQRRPDVPIETVANGSENTITNSYSLTEKPGVELEDKSTQVDIPVARKESGSDRKGSESNEEELSGEESDSTLGSQKQNEFDYRPFEKSYLHLEYSYDDEDNVLKTVIHIIDDDEEGFKLTPAYLLMMMIEHSASSFTELRTRRLLLKISTALQGVAWVSLT